MEALPPQKSDQPKRKRSVVYIDGFNLYYGAVRGKFSACPEAVDLAFGPYAKHGTIVRDYRNAEQPGGDAPPENLGSERRSVFGVREGEERSICTSHVERNNLTIRTLMKRFTRLSLGFSKKLENLEAACAASLAY